ncbi:intein-containing Rv2578c family radical SAM protein [Spirilliplanes yamanashiensis]|uniref:Radical SAM core domain-containing protein n=1 Tax=Spirilliplanes yamanashiensis TaxID=42233 RepID=A0A8J4DFV2_9ACTN|nr:intein-containing Rv2578c family radical SAM protein [Spirilliplanes yamanashiensis]MDP9814271.1 DNA repair photolyase [Spirilliplanes yamanashiensis]GIJ00746.1 hypothetical protein Sya03_00980 [Spirilliplanes yamanashiensis]
MRWAHLSAPPDATTPDAAPAAPPLPLALPGATVRTFDTPGFAGMTFYEVQAKSIINRVPGASRVPFEWTINPYRGCSHACSYCLAGDTPILLADGTHRPLADLRPGDAVYGTVGVGTDRRYVPTTVLDHWSTTKPAWRVTLADGTRLVASAEHRFLTARGWRHVGPGADRPHLAAGDVLLGPGGGFADPPKEDTDYRAGYVYGLVRGDAALVRRRRHLPGTPAGAPPDRRAPADTASGRGPRAAAGPPWPLPQACRPHPGRPAASAAAPAPAVPDRSAGGARTGRAAPPHDAAGPARSRPSASSADPWARADDYLKDLHLPRALQLPAVPTESFDRGLIAGLHAAAGRLDGLTVRFASQSEELLALAAGALARLGFAAREVRPRPFGSLPTLEAGGTLAEALRLWHVTGMDGGAPEATGLAVEGAAGSAVVAVEPLGLDMPLYDITTGTGDFVADGVVSHNCFARNTHTYLDLDAGHDFDSKVVVKVNAGELVRRELAAPRWQGQHIAMGTNVDCYQRAEGRYRLMPQIIAALRDFANPFSILTKGTLILRDLPLLRQAAEVTTVGLSMSIGFVDEQHWRDVEPGTPSPRRRLDAVRALTDAGFEVGVLMAPILPGLTDTDESIEETVAAIAAAGAASLSPLPLHLRPGAREWYARWLGRTHPELVPRYRELFGRGSYLPQAYQREITARVRRAARRHGLHRAEPGEARSLPDAGTAYGHPGAPAEQTGPGAVAANSAAQQLTLL